MGMDEESMTEREWMREGLDIKLTALLYRRKIWIAIVCALAGAVLGGGLYFVIHVVYAPAREYQGISKLYLTFDEDDDGDAYQYYNGYTWNDLMGTEPILDKIMEGVPAGMTRETVRDSITADILSDIRLLTVTVTTHDQSETDSILRAAEEALVRFGKEMIEFEKIEVIEHGHSALLAVADETVRAVIAGAGGGFLASLIGLALACILDDSVYVPTDFEKRYGYPVLGVTFTGNEEAGKEALERHIRLVTADKPDVIYIETGNPKIALPDEAGGGRGVILHIPYGSGNGKLLERWIAEIKLNNDIILGAVITDADLKLYRLYFATFGRAGRKYRRNSSMEPEAGREERERL